MSWFSKKSKRSIIRRKRSSAERIIFIAKRAGIVLGAFVLIGWLGSWFFLSDASYHTANWAKERLYNVTASAGFTVEDLLVEGRHHTDADAVMAIANIKKGDPLFSFNTQEAQKMLNKLSWVKEARVERRLPNTIYIGLEERKPLALWQHNQKLKLIDDEGVVLTSRNLKRFKDYIIIVGQDAPENAGSFLELLHVENLVKERVESAQFISGRRWDLKLKNDVSVKLPEKDVALALRQLSQAQLEESLLDKDIKMIDMRETDRIVIRTKPGAVQEYKASYTLSADQGNSI